MKTQIIAWGIFPRTLAGAADQDAVVMDDNPVDRRVVPLTVLADRLRRREGRSGQSRSLRKQIVPPPADYAPLRPSGEAASASKAESPAKPKRG